MQRGDRARRSGEAIDRPSSDKDRSICRGRRTKNRRSFQQRRSGWVGSRSRKKAKTRKKSEKNLRKERAVRRARGKERRRKRRRRDEAKAKNERVGKIASRDDRTRREKKKDVGE